MRAAPVLACLALAACTRSEASPARPAPSAAVAAPARPPTASPLAPPTAPPAAPAPYAFDRTHSPIDASVVASVRAIAAKNPKLNARAFAKVGDSVTYSDDSLRCFASTQRTRVPPELVPVVERFRPARVFERESESAHIGWSAWQALSGSPSPLERELAVLGPRFALVQYGTNDIEIGQLHHYADRMFDIVDFLSERGVVPILFTIMPRRDRAAAAVWVPRYNAVIRGIAQARRVPLVDYHREIEKLPGAGLGKDGIHPTTYHGSLGRNACDLGEDGLRHGYNLRNKLALEALDRASRALEGEVLDSAPGADRSRVMTFPHVDTPTFPQAGKLDGYSGCGAERAAEGPERVYRVDVDRPIALRALGFDRNGEVDLYLLSAADDPRSCRASGARVLEAQLSPGTHYLVLEASSPSAQTLLVLLADS